MKLRCANVWLCLISIPMVAQEEQKPMQRLVHDLPAAIEHSTFNDAQKRELQADLQMLEGARQARQSGAKPDRSTVMKALRDVQSKTQGSGFQPDGKQKIADDLQAIRNRNRGN